MNLLIFSPYYPPHLGGLENYTEELALHLAAKDFEITIFTSDLPISKNKISQNGKVKIIHFPAFEIVNNYPVPKFWSSEFQCLWRELKKTDFDIVISETRFFLTSLLAFFYARTKKKKWVHIEHGSDFPHAGNFLVRAAAQLYDFTFGRLVLKKANRVISVSEGVREFVKKLTSREDSRVIYRGFDLEKIERVATSETKRQSYENKTILTFVGRLYNSKGTAELIAAVSALENKEALACLIIGDGPQKKELEKKIKRLGLTDTVKLLGPKKYEEVIGLLKISDIFANPSYTEGLPTTVVEAALCGLAIVATNVGGTSEIITDEKSGYLVPPQNVPALKEKLERLIGDAELRQRFGENVKKEAVDKFNWNRSVEKFMVVFSEL